MIDILYLIREECKKCSEAKEKFFEEKGRYDALDDFMKAYNKGQDEFIFVWHDGKKHRLTCKLELIEPEEVDHASH